MSSLLKIRSVPLAVAALLGATLAHADTTIYDRQERAGLMLNIPFDSKGFVFKDSSLSLVYQNAKVKSSATGWQIALGIKLASFSPTVALSALGGDRCGYGTVGVSYGEGKWGLPVGIYGPYVQVGLSNIGGFGGFQAGLSTLGCFKRYTPPAAAVSASSSSASSFSASSSATSSSAPPSNLPSVAAITGQAMGGWLRSTTQSSDFDWA